MDIEKYESATYILLQIKEYQAESDKFSTANYIRFQRREELNETDSIIHIHNTHGDLAEAYKRFISEIRDFYTQRIGDLQKELDAL